jgi:hypothetical protein
MSLILGIHIEYPGVWHQAFALNETYHDKNGL